MKSRTNPSVWRGRLIRAVFSRPDHDVLQSIPRACAAWALVSVCGGIAMTTGYLVVPLARAFQDASGIDADIWATASRVGFVVSIAIVAPVAGAGVMASIAGRTYAGALSRLWLSVASLLIAAAALAAAAMVSVPVVKLGLVGLAALISAGWLWLLWLAQDQGGDLRMHGQSRAGSGWATGIVTTGISIVLAILPGFYGGMAPADARVPTPPEAMNRILWWQAGLCVVAAIAAARWIPGEKPDREVRPLGLGLRRTQLEVRREGRTRVLCQAWGLSAATVVLVEVYAVRYAQEHLGQNVAHAARVFAIGILAGSILALVAGPLAAARPRLTIGIGGFTTILGFGTAALGFVTDSRDVRLAIVYAMAVLIEIGSTILTAAIPVVLRARPDPLDDARVALGSAYRFAYQTAAMISFVAYRTVGLGGDHSGRLRAECGVPGLHPWGVGVPVRRRAVALHHGRFACAAHEARPGWADGRARDRRR